MTLIADVFPEVLAPKNMVRSMSKKPFLRGFLDRQQGKWVKTLLQSERQHLYNIYQSLSRQLLWKKSLSVIHKILRLFVNTLTVNGKHFLLNRDNLTQPMQMQLSQKQKTFSQFLFLNFYNLYSILNICQKRIPLAADVFPEIPAQKNMF